MARSVKVDFFRVRIEVENVAFERLLADVDRLEPLERNLEIRGDVLRLHVLHHWHHNREGDMTRIRLNDLPSRATVEGELAAIDLADGEGLAEQAAFLYVPEIQVLLLQRNRFSVTPGNFAYYIEEKAGFDQPIFLDPILQEDAVRRLTDFRVVRQFQVRFARVNNPQALGEDRSTREMIDILNYFNAPSADIKLSMGNNEGSLPLERVRAAARAFLGHATQQPRQPNDVTSIEIRGTDEDGERDILDLVKFKMVEEIQVESEGRRLPYDARRRALREAYGNREDELNRMMQ